MEENKMNLQTRLQSETQRGLPVVTGRPEQVTEETSAVYSGAETPAVCSYAIGPNTIAPEIIPRKSLDLAARFRESYSAALTDETIDDAFDQINDTPYLVPDHEDAQPLTHYFQNPVDQESIEPIATTIETRADSYGFKAPQLNLIGDEEIDRMFDSVFDYSPQASPVTQVLPQPEISTGYGLAA
tara:strand:- start:104 stop:658 length:555 start_codon:yes stop_codon:yes gene_type:complete